MAGITRAERARRDALLAHGLKRCCPTKGCGTDKPLDAFYERADGYAGRRATCIECVGVAHSDYQKRTPELQAARQKRWRHKNPERSAEITKRYRDAHPLEERLRSGRYRAENLGLPADRITTDELRDDWKRRGIDPAKDAYTGDPLVSSWHLDHVWPLSDPNSPGHVVTNLVPANPETNREKTARGLVDFLADRAAAAREAITNEVKELVSV